MKKIFVFFAVVFGFNVAIADTIHPISREMGSGTRGAFVEIFGIQKEIKGKKVDAITTKAEVTNSTGVMLTSVSNSKNSIGYISLGSVNDSIKILKIDGVYPSVENVKNKSYVISRPFNLVFKDASALAKDFISYALSAKDVIEKAGYIPTSSNEFVSAKPAGKLVISGSSSITPLMEKLVESYRAQNPNASIDILQSDSTTGINSVLDGIAHIGMVSRDLRESELKRGLEVQVFAIDGLALIVNKANGVENLSRDEVRKIFTGEIDNWDLLLK